MTLVDLTTSDVRWIAEQNIEARKTFPDWLRGLYEGDLFKFTRIRKGFYIENNFEFIPTLEAWYSWDLNTDRVPEYGIADDVEQVIGELETGLENAEHPYVVGLKYHTNDNFPIGKSGPYVGEIPDVEECQYLHESEAQSLVSWRLYQHKKGNK